MTVLPLLRSHVGLVLRGLNVYQKHYPASSWGARQRLLRYINPLRLTLFLPRNITNTSSFYQNVYKLEPCLLFPKSRLQERHVSVCELGTNSRAHQKALMCVRLGLAEFEVAKFFRLDCNSLPCVWAVGDYSVHCHGTLSLRCIKRPGLAPPRLLTPYLSNLQCLYQKCSRRTECLLSSRNARRNAGCVLVGWGSSALYILYLPSI
jgi:hypothetical protein